MLRLQIALEGERIDKRVIALQAIVAYVVKKSEYEEVYLPFDQKPLYAQMSDGDDWTGVCRGCEYFGDDITDHTDGVTRDITASLAINDYLLPPHKG